MGRVVGSCDATDLFCFWVGVIQTTDQVVDASAAGIDQNDLAAACIGTNAHPVLPVDGGSIKVW